MKKDLASRRRDEEKILKSDIALNSPLAIAGIDLAPRPNDDDPNNADVLAITSFERADGLPRGHDAEQAGSSRWSDADKASFALGFHLFPFDFEKIAAIVGNKTVSSNEGALNL